MQEYTCCFFGHREIDETEELKHRIRETVEKLITEEKIDTFLFGSKSAFDRLCLKIVTELKEKHPHIRRVYVRGEFPVIGEQYTAYLLRLYDDTYYPESVLGAGKAAYVERNMVMIDGSRFCVVYCDDAYAPVNRKSGTKIALDYAEKRGKIIVNLSRPSLEKRKKV